MLCREAELVGEHEGRKAVGRPVLVEQTQELEFLIIVCAGRSSSRSGERRQGRDEADQHEKRSKIVGEVASHVCSSRSVGRGGKVRRNVRPSHLFRGCLSVSSHGNLLYTSDAADDLLCVDLGGRRI